MLVVSVECLNNKNRKYNMFLPATLITYSVSRHKQRLISGAQLIKESVGQFLTAGPQFTYRGEHTLSNISLDPTTADS